MNPLFNGRSNIDSDASRFPYVYRPLWFQLCQHWVMKMYHSRSHQEINLECNEALALLKLSVQLEKELHRACCV